MGECARAGENDLSKWGQGRFHMVKDDAEGTHGHCTQEELLVEQKQQHVRYLSW